MYNRSPSSVTLSLTIIYESVLGRVLRLSVHIYSSYLSLYSPFPVLHSLLIYTRIELSVFVGNQHSAVAVDIYVGGCGQGRGERECTDDTLVAEFYETADSDT